MKKTSLTLALLVVSLAVLAQKPDISFITPQVFTLNVEVPLLTPTNIGGAMIQDGGSISTIAGSTTSGLVNGTGNTARFYYPSGVAVDKNGNIFVTDKYNHVIRKITPAGDVSTFAGSGSNGYADGQGTAASFYYPTSLVIDLNDNLYVSDQYNQRIRKITKDGQVSTFAGNGITGLFNSNALGALFNYPDGLALDTAGNLYIGDINNNCIRKISASGNVTTLAGNGSQGAANGIGSTATFNYPNSLAVDAFGNVFVADQKNHMIRKITPSGVVSTYAGTGTIGSTDGPCATATFNYPSGIVLDRDGNLFVTDRDNNKIRKISPQGIVSTFAGIGIAGFSDGSINSGKFNFPWAMAFDLSGNLILADRYNHAIRRIIESKFDIQPSLPAGLTFNPLTGSISGKPLVASESTKYRITAKNAYGGDTTYLNVSIQSLSTVQTNAVSSLSKTSVVANGYIVDPGMPKVNSYGFCWNKTGNPTLTDSIIKRDTTTVVGPYSFQLKSLSPRTTYYVRAFATNEVGTSFGSTIMFTTLGDEPNISYNIPTNLSAGLEIAPIKPNNEGGQPQSYGYIVSTFAGNGTASMSDGIGVEAGLNYPMGVAVDSAGYIYAVDRHNNRICKISPSGKLVTLAGNGQIGNADGKGKNASFNMPYGIDLDASGNAYVVDRYNNTIRKITPDGMVTTFAGSGATGSADGVGKAASFNWPTGVAVDSIGNLIIADTYNNKIRKITPEGVVTTVAGNGSIGTADGSALTASFNVPTGVEVDGSGAIWVADVNNNMIRKISTGGIVSTIAGNGERRFADGTGRAAGFFFPYSLIMDPKGDFLVGDANNNRIRKVTKDGLVTTIAGNGEEASVDGLPAMASFNYPADVAYDAFGNLFVADAENHKIRKIAPKCYTITPELPIGLMFDNLTGVISGKPLKGSPTTEYSIVTANSNGADTTRFMLSILDTPVISTQPITSILSNSAIGNGNFINLGFPYPTSYGFCLSKSGIPTIDSLKIDKGATSIGGLFSAKLTNLQPNTRYVVRAFAVNSFGTTYGDTLSFTSAGPAPEISYPINEQIFTAGMPIAPILLTNKGGELISYLKVSTYAGSRVQGAADGSLLKASFNRPNAVAFSSTGDMYVADTYNHKIRLITPEGVVKTLAGTGVAGSSDGPAATSSFNMPISLTVDKVGNIFVSDSYNNKIRKITKDGQVVTIAGNGAQGSTNGIGINATFNNPSGIVIDSIGNLYVSDYNNYKIRKIDTAGVVTTFAGNTWGSMDAVGEAASFKAPSSLAIDHFGNLYVIDIDANKVRKITPDRVVSTFAGSGSVGSKDGLGVQASFYYPSGIAVDSKGNCWIVDTGNNKIRKISPSGLVTTVSGTGNMSGTDGETSVATFGYPLGIGIDLKDNVFVTEMANNDIRLISTVSFDIDPELPAGLKFDFLNGTLSGTPTTGSSMITYSILGSNQGGRDTAQISIAVQGKPSTATLTVETISSSSAYVLGRMLNVGYPAATNFGICWNKTGEPSMNDSVQNASIAVSAGLFDIFMKNLIPGNTYFVRTFATNAFGTSLGEVLKFTTLEVAPNIQYDGPQTYSVDTEILPLKPINKGGAPTAFQNVSTFSGTGTKSSVDGIVSNASYSLPSGIAFDSEGNLFVSDAGSNKIRKISTDGTVTTFAGSGLSGSMDGKGTAASFNAPRGLTIDSNGILFVADTYNHKIRKISKDGDVTTLAGSGIPGKTLGLGAAASFNFPTGIAVDTSGNVYVADMSNHRICMINPAGIVTTLAGYGLSGSSDGKGLNAYFNQPAGVAVDKFGNVFITDYGNNMIRKISKDSMVITIAGKTASGQVDGIGANARFYGPMAIVLDSIGNLFITEYNYGKVRMITQKGEVTTYAGQNYNYGYADGRSTNALFYSPSGIAIDKAGMVYVADYGNNRIRKITPAYFSISPSLPVGLHFDDITGTISGKPTTSTSARNYVISAFNTGGECNAEIMITIAPVGLENMETKVLILSPNPASTYIRLTGLRNRELLSVYSLTGVKLLSQEVFNGEHIDISRLKSGLYIVKVGGVDLKLVKK